MEDSSIAKIFTEYQDFINKEQDLKEEIRVVVKEIEQLTREILMVLQNIHQKAGADEISECCKKANSLFEPVREKYVVLASKIPANQFYRFYDMWRFANQRLAFLVSLTYYLENGTLASRELVTQTLGVKLHQKDGFHLDLEDYLTGLLLLASELARFATNSVTNGDYDRPIAISKFVTELNAGFRLLNLKNDMLRKRYDALKYDVKKIEEVVYDLSIRGLRTTHPTAPENA
ncbi:hypothetical protein B566_EDAN007609 [Ephemera danica]|nr:hypothetical protein B566_EDAN007609 [Ephemera danica]